MKQNATNMLSALDEQTKALDEFAERIAPHEVKELNNQERNLIVRYQAILNRKIEILEGKK